MRAAIYTRMSIDKQSEMSPEGYEPQTLGNPG